MSNNRDLQAALVDWLSSDAPAVAATLTFLDSASGRRLTEEQAREAVRIYLRKLDKAAYGAGAKYRGMQVEAVSVMEGGPGWFDKRIHYHLWLKVPDHLQPEEWLGIARRQWITMELAGIEKEFRQTDDAGWLAYILKPQDKPSYMDAVDLGNLRVNQRRSALKACSESHRMMTEPSSRLASTARSCTPA